ncbi:MAG: hypothetical protein JWQ10_1046 [Herbaspirillum sp.]|jgi:hypothetical protein|nr:hypothetical protein [Herbaspirillum sp.]
MSITPRILGLIIPLLLIGCTKWGPDKKGSRAVDLYLDVQETTPQGTIPSGTVCRVDQRVSGGKVDAFHKIECQNGQSGYLKLGDDEEVFEPKHQPRRADWGPDKKASRAVDLYPEIQELTTQGIILSGAICRIDQRFSSGRAFIFHKIECQNGQSGYLLVGDEQAFEPTH